MPKKMHDILPPKPKQALAAKKATVRVKKPKAVVAEKPKYEVPARKLKKERRFPLKELLVGGAVILVLLGIFVATKLPKADVEIWPKLDVLNITETIKADKSATATDLVAKVIPARYLEVIKTASQDFPATGLSSADGKATGIIRVYNKVSPSAPFTLVAGTHFLSDSGKYFVSTAKIIIPASKGSAAGSITVAVQAQDVGPDYNIGASKFSLPKLNGTAYYYSIYGESTTAMVGGHTGKVKQVSSDDLQSAADVLTKQVATQAQTDLKNQIGKDEVLLDGAMVTKVVTSSASVKAGTVVNTFTENASVKASALVFKKADLQGFIQSDIIAQVPAAQSYLQNSVTLNYTPKSVDISGGKEQINVVATAKTYYTIDTKALVDIFSTKSSAEVKQVMDQMYSGKIAELKINLWPFWVTTVPSDKNRIKVNLNF